MVEKTKDGLNIEIVDQDGRLMFPDGRKEPYERTRRLIQKMAPALKAMVYRNITGHTAASKVPPKPGYGAWALSADRANAVREIHATEGLLSGHIFMVAGNADTDPLFPDNSHMSQNRRVTLMKEAPPLPANFTPVKPAKAVLWPVCRAGGPRRTPVLSRPLQ
jgi:chemotaxis protein MotB